VPALLAEALDVESVAVALMRADREGIEVRASFGLEDDWMASTQVLSRPHTPFWQSLASAGPRVLDAGAALSEQSRPIRVPDEARSGAVIPLLDRDRSMGLMIALSRQPRRFDHDALHLLQSVANLIAALVQRRRTEELLA